MGYSEALTAAGARVLEYNEFGSYQGTWGAIVDYQGKIGLVTGSYGSCSVCDAFQSEFFYNGPCTQRRDGKWENTFGSVVSKEEASVCNTKYEEKLAEFGASYLHTILEREDVQRMIDQYNSKPDQEDWFDQEEREIYDWAITFFSSKHIL